MYLIRFRYVPPAAAELQEDQPDFPISWTSTFELPPSARDFVAHQQNLFQVVSRRPLSFAESARQRSPEQHGVSAFCTVKWVHKMSDRPVPADEQELLEALDSYI